MPDSKKRVVFYVTEADLEKIDRIKQTDFYDRSYAELFRYLVRLGIDAAKERRP